MMFKRRWGTMVWHWHATCSHWTTLGALIDERPIGQPLPFGQLCDECLAHPNEAGAEAPAIAPAA